VIYLITLFSNVKQFIHTFEITRIQAGDRDMGYRSAADDGLNSTHLSNNARFVSDVFRSGRPWLRVVEGGVQR
jgi:hypothetical protein